MHMNADVRYMKLSRLTTDMIALRPCNKVVRFSDADPRC